MYCLWLTQSVISVMLWFPDSSRSFFSADNWDNNLRSILIECLRGCRRYHLHHIKSEFWMSLLPTQSTCLPDFCAILQTLWPAPMLRVCLASPPASCFAFFMFNYIQYLPEEALVTRWATKYAFEILWDSFSQSVYFCSDLGHWCWCLLMHPNKTCLASAPSHQFEGHASHAIHAQTNALVKQKTKNSGKPSVRQQNQQTYSPSWCWNTQVACCSLSSSCLWIVFNSVRLGHAAVLEAQPYYSVIGEKWKKILRNISCTAFLYRLCSRKCFTFQPRQMLAFISYDAIRLENYRFKRKMMFDGHIQERHWILKASRKSFSASSFSCFNFLRGSESSIHRHRLHAASLPFSTINEQMTWVCWHLQWASHSQIASSEPCSGRVLQGLNCWMVLNGVGRSWMVAKMST